MKFPKVVKIKGQNWKTKIQNNISLDGIEVDGLCVFDEKCIYISNTVSDDRKIEVWLHEFIHASVFELHLNESGGISPAIEEVLCSGLAQIINSNFKLKFFLAK